MTERFSGTSTHEEALKGRMSMVEMVLFVLLGVVLVGWVFQVMTAGDGPRIMAPAPYSAQVADGADTSPL